MDVVSRVCVCVRLMRVLNMSVVFFFLSMRIVVDEETHPKTTKTHKFSRELWRKKSVEKEINNIVLQFTTWKQELKEREIRNFREAPERKTTTTDIV